MKRFCGISALVMALLLLIPAHAAAQDGPMPLTWVGLVKVKPGTGPQFEKLFEKYNQPLMDQLVSDGTAMSWGLGYELAGPGGYDYVMWITMPGWAGMGTVEAAFDAQYEGMSEEDLATMMTDWMAVIEPDGDETQLLRHMVFKGTPEAEYNYLLLSAFTAKTGYGDDLTKMYESFVAPVYQKLFEDGVIAGYGLAEQAVHADHSFTHESWITFKELADLETVEKAFQEDEVSAGDEAARDLAFRKMIEPDTHFDRLIRVTKHSK